MNMENIREKNNAVSLPLNLAQCGKSQSQDKQSSKGTKRYEPCNILIKNYINQTGSSS